MQITPSLIDTAKPPADWFTGDVYIDSVAAAPPPSRGTLGRASYRHQRRSRRSHGTLGAFFDATGPIGWWIGLAQPARNSAATGANFSWNWKIPPCPESG